MVKIPFSDGTKISSAKVTIDEVDYPVTPARYTGATPLSSTVLNTMQTNIENAINQNTDNIGGEDYDATATYVTGDIVKHEGQLYIANTDIDTPEAWDSTHWDETDVLSSAGGNEIAIGTSADITGKTKLFVEESTQTLKYKSSTTGQFENLTSEDIVIGEPEDVTSETKIFIDESEGTDAYSEVVNSLAGNEIAKAPSVRAVNNALRYSETETICGYDDNGKPIYRRVVAGTFPEANTAGNPKYYTDLAEITNLKDLYRYDATFGNRAPFSSNFYGGANYIVSYLENNKVIIVTTLAIQTTYTYRIIIEYTKTTD